MMGVSALLTGDGVFPGSSLAGKKQDSPKKRGIKQGVFIFLLTFLVVPLVAMFHVATKTEPFIAAIATILLIFGGLLRVVYALMFESGEPTTAALEEGSHPRPQVSFGHPDQNAGLPSGESVPAAAYMRPAPGKWKDTNDLATPMSVTDTTTKLLSEEKRSDQ